MQKTELICTGERPGALPLKSQTGINIFTRNNKLRKLRSGSLLIYFTTTSNSNRLLFIPLASNIAPTFKEPLKFFAGFTISLSTTS